MEKSLNPHCSPQVTGGRFQRSSAVSTTPVKLRPSQAPHLMLQGPQTPFSSPEQREELLAAQGIWPVLQGGKKSGLNIWHGIESPTELS